ncbi:hypothetical protein [Azospirillum picis]|uniref:Oligosaccharide repeat unit polymerase n=1 Tax=Azospirillum picis TaxID=488438 RepID=A0ABU0MSE7_9PROT|nr:hypothetical protein [Azospirillum picis]MBP2300861.1 hypothetical protein [Azospirillum picis]MDQ0536118.1 hypothetical protein [Azospirillum picis]
MLGRKGRIYEYPFFAGAMFFSFVLPQLPGLAGDPYLPEGAFAKTMVVTLSCAVMLWLGWAVTNRPMRAFAYEMSEQRLITAAAALSAAGAFFYFKISHLPVEVRDLSLPTGLPVAYNFFAKMLGYGFTLATICFVRTGSRLALVIALFGAMFYLERIIFAGRRGDTSEFVLIILLSYWFERGRTVPRALALAAVLVGTLVMNSTGDYRKVAKAEEGPSLDRVMQIDFVGNLKDLLANGGPEMLNAVYKINAIDENMILDFGAFHWNTLVFNYIPAQVTGTEFKDLLFIPIRNPYAFTAHAPATGSTETGMADGFGSFWYFGAIKFFLIGLVLKRLYCAAMQRSIPGQFLYMLLLTPGMLAITHHTHFILNIWVHLSIFVYPVLLWSRKPADRFAPTTLGRSGPIRDPRRAFSA